MIAVGSDHAGYALKEKIKKYLEESNISYKDFGTFSEESCDYPVFAEKVADSVANGESSKGILACGTGIGVSIAANKVKGIRAALCYEPSLAEMSRKHNDANVICLGGRITSLESAKTMVDVFLSTDFEGGRHEKRVKEIKDIENR
jgi:ribose 5-phosphate isomerase B